MNKEQKAKHQQRLINNLNHKLFQIETSIKQGPTGPELQLLETRAAKIKVRLMDLYHTNKYGLVDA